MVGARSGRPIHGQVPREPRGGDFRRVHRTALIAWVHRASQWRHQDVEPAAHDLLQLLDERSG